MQEHGGAPKKYVSGAWVEAKIAVRTAIEEIENIELLHINEDEVNKEKERILRFMDGREGLSHEELERILHETMDEYAGGATAHYELTESKLIIARDKLKEIEEKLQYIRAKDKHELVSCLELIDRFDVAKVLLEHLIYRQETRWPVFQIRTDYPERKKMSIFIDEDVCNRCGKAEETVCERICPGYCSEIRGTRRR